MYHLHVFKVGDNIESVKWQEQEEAIPVNFYHIKIYD